MDVNARTITELSASVLAERIRDGDLTPTDAVDAYLQRIDERDDEINAYVTVTDGLARETAAALDERVSEAAGSSVEADLGRLCGVPVALKDLGDAKAGVRHTMGSTLLADAGYESPRTSVVVERLEAAGAVILGKTNVPEFGHKGTTDNAVVGPTASPTDPSLNAGGSSGGSAAAVGAGMAALALGSDAGGSIRIPATACGVFGLKPSFGLVPGDSRPNAFRKKRHHTATGPLSRTVADAALAMAVIAGPHPSDPSSIPVDIDYVGAVGRDIGDLRVAYSPDLDVFPVDDDVSSVAEAAVSAFEDAGAAVESVELDHGLTMGELRDAVVTTFSTAMLGANVTIRESFGFDLRDHPETVTDSLLEMLELGEDRTVEDVAATGIVRTRVFDAVQAIFADYDALATPTLGVPGLGLRESLEPTEWEAALTWPFNWTGHPAASVPAGLTDAGRPVGLQLVGRRYEDDTVIAASAAFERERPWLG
ncbi:amidase (plasmid) [Haloferacaceae archaeon DSL9]